MTFFSLLADVLPVPVLWMATLAAAGTSDPLATPPPWRGRARRSEPAIVAGPAPCPLVEAEASCKVVKRNAAK